MGYIHNELRHGKDIHGTSLQQALQNLFDECATETVTTKLAPCMDSQRNESLNGTIGSKNLKIRHYGGSEGSNFCTACGVAQHNEGHKPAKPYLQDCRACCTWSFSQLFCR